MKIKFSKGLKLFLVVVLISVWTFYGWPPIWQNPKPPADAVVQGDFILTGNDNFRVDEKPEFRIHMPVKMTVKMTVKKSVAKLLGLFGAQTASAQSPMPRLLKSEVVDHAGKKMNVELSAELIGREIKITVPKPDSRQFQPGKFTLNVEMLAGEEIITKSQDFIWGVLAINTNKSVFLPGETAYLQMTSLNEYGRASCDSKLELKIKNSENGAEKIFFTESGTIKKSDTCGPNNVTDSPDYFAYYETAAPGIYQMHLTNLDTGYDTTDSFEVREHVPLEVERVGATRINPFLSNYKMTLRVKADQDFDGTVTEKMPSDFEVIDAGGGIAGNNAAEKEVVWKVNLKNGEQTTLQYEYKAPEISPEIFLLGPAEFIQDGSVVFTEARQWQIGSDVTYNCTLPFTTAQNWNGASWQTCNSSYPGATGTADTATVTFGAGTANRALTLNVSPANALGAVVFDRPTGTKGMTFVMGANTLSAASFALGGTTGTTVFTYVTISTGTLTVTGALTSAGVASKITCSGACIINAGGAAGILSGTAGTFTAGGTSIVNFNGSSAQTQTTAYTYDTFKINNAAGVSLAGAATITTLTIGDVTPSSVFSDGGQTITPGASSVLNLTSGTYNLGSVGTATAWPAWGTRNITGGTTVGYVSGAAQSVSTTPTEYKNVTFSGAGTKTVAAGGTLTVTGNFDTTGGTATFTTTANLTVTGNITNNGAITMGSGTITIGGNWTNSGTFTAGTSLVNYNTAAGGQTVGGVTYNNLTLSNSSNTDTAGGAITVNGTLTTTSGGTLDMTAAYTFGGTLATITNAGTIKTSVPTATSAVPLATGKTWGSTGTVLYAGATAQTVMQGTYSGDLTFSGAGAKTTEAGTITVTGNWDVSGGTATLNTNNTSMTVTGNITNSGGTGNITSGSGTISLQGNWTSTGTFTANTGAVTYAKTTGGQTVGGLTYNNVAFSNSSNTDTAGGAITVNGTLTTTSGGTLDMSTYQLLGAVTPTNNGAITTSNTTNPAIPASKNWTGTTGTVTFALAGGGQFIPAGTYKTLTLSNTSGTDTAAGAITATTLTTGSSILDMATYDLAVTNITNNGTIKTQSVSTTPLSANKTWGGTVNFNAGSGTTQTIVYGTYDTLTATASLARTIKFNASQTTNVTTWTVTGSSGQLITLTTDTGATQWTINPTAASVSYADISNSNNTGASFCATFSQSTSGNNTLWDISSGASCTSLTFTVSTDNFATLTPGTPVQATTTLNVNTNNASGWNVTLSGDNVTNTAQTMNNGGAVEITDKDPQWIMAAATATTTAGNAVAVTNGDDVLAFRVMSASSTNSVAFLSTAWWGTSDAMFNGSQLWAGIASSTNAGRIGNAGTGSYSASDHLNTVQYYLDVPGTQKTGTYTGNLTYTTTVNP